MLPSPVLTLSCKLLKKTKIQPSGNPRCVGNTEKQKNDMGRKQWQLIYFLIKQFGCICAVIKVKLGLSDFTITPLNTSVLWLYFVFILLNSVSAWIVMLTYSCGLPIGLYLFPSCEEWCWECFWQPENTGTQNKHILVQTMDLESVFSDQPWFLSCRSRDRTVSPLFWK